MSRAQGEDVESLASLILEVYPLLPAIPFFRYEYLERRFCTTLRTVAALIFVFKTILYVPCVCATPCVRSDPSETTGVTGVHVSLDGSLRSLQVLGGGTLRPSSHAFNAHDYFVYWVHLGHGWGRCGLHCQGQLRAFICGCSFAATFLARWSWTLIPAYVTLQGGMRAVIWTDAIQSVVMIAVAIAALTTAVDRCGGVAKVYAILQHNGMLIDPSYYFGWHPLTHAPPAERNWTLPDSENALSEVHTNDFWSLALGVTLTSVAQGFADQLAAQRWLSVTDTAAMQRGVYQTGLLQVCLPPSSWWAFAGVGLTQLIRCVDHTFVGDHDGPHVRNRSHHLRVLRATQRVSGAKQPWRQLRSDFPVFCAARAASRYSGIASSSSPRIDNVRVLWWDQRRSHFDLRRCAIECVRMAAFREKDAQVCPEDDCSAVGLLHRAGVCCCRCTFRNVHTTCHVGVSCGGVSHACSACALLVCIDRWAAWSRRLCRCWG